MQLEERKKQILSAIVRLYIATGEPVGSKLLANSAGLNLSSATIRNEMSELAEMGYLEQPHTSAGRIPTQKGYRTYVDSLMQTYRLTPEERELIDGLLKIESPDLESLLSKAGEKLAELTGCAAVSAVTQEGGAELRRVEIMPAGRRSLLLVLLSSGGVVRSRLCRTGEDLNADMLSFFAQLLAERLEGLPLSEVTPELFGIMKGELYEYTYALAPVLGMVYEEIQKLSGAEVFLGGETNLLGHPGVDPNEALGLIRFLENGDGLMRLLDGIAGGTHVRIGDETGLDSMRSSSLIATPYGVGGRASGTIGIIGPTRIDYPRLISHIAYFSDVLSTLINEFFGD